MNNEEIRLYSKLCSIEIGIQNCYERIFFTNGNMRDLVFLKDMQNPNLHLLSSFSEKCTSYDWGKIIKELPNGLERNRLQTKLNRLHTQIQLGIERRLKKQLINYHDCDGEKIDTITFAGKVFNVHSTMLEIRAGWL